MTGDDLLRVEGLSTYFTTAIGVLKVVDEVTFHIGRGEAVGLVGESGCGKTTVALSIMRLTSENAKTVGAIMYKGKNLLELSEAEMERVRGREISMVFQQHATHFNPLMRVGDQIAESVKGRLNSGANVEERVIEIMRLVRIPDPQRMSRYYPHQLSGGTKQRVMIGMAIGCKAPLLIADEPTTEVDATTQGQLLKLIKELKNSLGISLLLISHNLGVVAQLCDRVYIMYAGKIVESAEASKVFAEPKHPYTVGLMKCASGASSEGSLYVIDGTPPSPVERPPGCSFNPRCPYAMEICRREEPKLREVDTKHQVACWLHADQ